MHAGAWNWISSGNTLSNRQVIISYLALAYNLDVTANCLQSTKQKASADTTWLSAKHHDEAEPNQFWLSCCIHCNASLLS